ncbi:MAG: T9SS C-terminal target domain-containing protein [Calditrichaeota bacterium]|nr:MAG: T9SS C-terminal target domain-containing protein [Calditrichota bacterium]MBL1207571.1 T9SS C-terminal target domain-containing protein [Calditrichota bacterium]NOG47403.1 T9SS type A sorting domain-containing protein [Calditrichota bacterium]
MYRFLIFCFIVLISASELFSYQNIKIAAIRVEFLIDDNDLTTGDGTFLVDSVTTDPFAIDPAPHNRTYFKDQIIAAGNYFNSVSNGNVQISGDVFPKSMNGAYSLAREMSYYNPNTTQSEIDKGIGNLFVDAITVADEDPDFNYSDYDLVVIFHAGVGRDIDLGFDETPQDIPSLFVTADFMKEKWDDSFSGISVDGGNTVIRQGIILPETENQQDVQVALTGLFVSNIGSYLGLLDLFSPGEQRSGIGRFGLMDVGLFNISGLIPAIPSPFSRKKLGWESPHYLTSNQNSIQIAQYGSAASNTVPSLIEIAVNQDESFLLEYRHNQNSNIDSLQFEISKDRDEFAGHMEVLKTFFEDEIEISDSSGVLLSVKNYDIGLPGKGILIWHIDQSVIRNNESNSINDDPEWRAVDLEEADGSQDIGESYSLLDAGYQSELGTLFDYWFKGNDAPLYKNIFSAESRPNSLSNLNRANTGITISNFSSNKSEIMTFDFKKDFHVPGFPKSLKSSGKPFTISAKPELNSGIPAIEQADWVFTINESGAINAFGKNGEGLLFQNKNILAKVDANSTGIQSIALADTNGNGNPELLIAMSGGTLSGFDITVADDSLAKEIFSTTENITAAVNSPIVVDRNQIFYVDGININRFSVKGLPNGFIGTSLNMNDVLIKDLTAIRSTFDFDFIGAVNSNEIVYAVNSENTENETTEYFVTDSTGVLKHSFTSDKLLGQFSIAVLESTPAIVFNSQKELHVKNLNGSAVINFPIRPNLLEDEYFVGTPAIVDASGEDDIVIIVTTNKGQLFAYDQKGNSVEGFPLSFGGSFSESAIVVQLNDDTALELVAVSNSGIASAIEIPGTNTSSEIIWGSSNFNSANNADLDTSYTTIPISDNLLPKSRFFNYPNPNEGDETTIRYFLNEAAEVNILIFDAAGYKIDEFSGPGLAFTANEVKWQVGNVASGVYICQLEAVSETRTERKMIKILVVH